MIFRGCTPSLFSTSRCTCKKAAANLLTRLSHLLAEDLGQPASLLWALKLCAGHRVKIAHLMVLIISISVEFILTDFSLKDPESSNVFYSVLLVVLHKMTCLF